jgi:hypothetical protein
MWLAIQHMLVHKLAAHYSYVLNTVLLLLLQFAVDDWYID